MIRKLLVAGAVIAGVVALGAGPAFAHVEFEREGEVSSDGTVSATLNVPNEEANASTTQVELVFPESPKLTTATRGPVPGWTAWVAKSPSGEVTGIPGTGGKISGEDKVASPLTLGPAPADTDTIVFRAVQTYDNGV